MTQTRVTGTELSAYAQVPDVAPDAEPDPYWLQGRDTWTLPTAYLPPVMTGPHAWWQRLAVWVLIAIFLTATSLGVCLTYGPGR